ncbi:hypothetical protein BH10BAC4_BH10BAC4_06310 [soil metagenome]
MKKVCVGLMLAFLMSCSTDQVLTTEEQLARDVAAIDKYLADNSITGVIIEPSGSGVRYKINGTQGTGVKPVASSKITVTYVGRLMTNGNIFDQSTSASGVEFTLSQLIEGWRIAFPLLPKGTSATLYIPSGKAYGTKSQSNIPANSNLLFDVVLKDVK